jgi:hypothetical protein
MQFKSLNCNVKGRVLKFFLHLEVLNLINFYVEQIYLCANMWKTMSAQRKRMIDVTCQRQSALL